MAVASLPYASSLSSLAPTIPSLVSDAPIPQPATLPLSFRGSASRRSISVFSRFPRDFSTLIRSASTSRTTALAELEESRDKVVLTEYADIASYNGNFYAQPEMQATENEQTPKRSENKFYNFFNRSRSRSRSKAGRSISVDAVAIPEMPSTSPPRINGQSIEPILHKGAEGPSKPRTRVQSRPLSSTTTATNTTVTPRSPTKSPKNRPPDGSGNPTNNSQENYASLPKTRKPSSTRKKLHDLFGISLNSRKSSRANSPLHTHDHETSVPVSHGFINSDPHGDHDITSSSTQTHTTVISQPRPSSSSKARNRGKSNSPATSKLDYFRSPRIFSGATVSLTTNSSQLLRSDSKFTPVISPAQEAPLVHSPSLSQIGPPLVISNAPFSKENSHPQSSCEIPEKADIDVQTSVSQPTENPPDLPQHQNSFDDTRTSVADSMRRHSNISPNSRSVVIPTITHTPATPLKSPPTSPSKSPTRLGYHRDPNESRNRQGDYVALAVVEEGSSTRREKAKKDDGKRRASERPDRERGRWSPRLSSTIIFGARENIEVKDKGKGREKDVRKGAVSTSRVGSPIPQDRERPSTSQGVTRRDSSSKPANSKVSRSARRTKHGSFDFERPFWRIGSVASSVVRSGYSQSGDSLYQPSTSAHSIERSLSLGSRPPTTPDSSLPQLPSQYMGSSFASQVPSRSTAHTRNGSGSTHVSSSLGRVSGKRMGHAPDLGGVGLTHRPFFFEPAVSSLTGDASSITTSAHQDSLPAPAPPSKGHRPRGKGRSLDLGLGLAWAPRKVREEALMSFGRTATRLATTENEPDPRVKLGPQVTQAFREVLDDAEFASFKKYVRRFDTKVIPFEGPSGVVARVEKLLDSAPGLGTEAKAGLLNDFIRIVLKNA